VYRPSHRPAPRSNGRTRQPELHPKRARYQYWMQPRSSRKSCCQTSIRRGLNSWQKGVTEPPYAFVIPDGQGDPTRVRNSWHVCWPRESRCIALALS